MYTLKSIARRGSMLGFAAAIAVAAVLPAASAFADALNPLTDRSLLLSSSAPGFQDTDGSGNSETNLNANGETFAIPGSGANGKKTGETFSFKVSTNSDDAGKQINAFTFQYCTSAAGLCRAPGNNVVSGTPDLSGPDTATTSDLSVNYATGSTFGALDSNDFAVYENDVLTAATDWVLTTDNKEDAAHSEIKTGKQNFITLTSATGITPATGTEIKVVFRASTTRYITNPGEGAFFVKLNTYNTTDPLLHIPLSANNLDGGVTVANVMTDSIHITTKVLETMQFSVGTRNPDTQVRTLPATHGTCDPIEKINGNRLDLGDVNAEYSLSTSRAFDVYSYWRLSSNSSGGATVYYSGNTLANTVGDEIAEIGPAAQLSHPSTEQFGLAFVGSTYGDTLSSSFNDAVAAASGHKVPELEALGVYDPDGAGPLPAVDGRLAAYRGGEGVIGDGTEGSVPTASFAFEKESNTIPKVIASDNSKVVSCATAKMRYVANIAADTPAGVYTTKINYLAAPQY